MISATKPGYFGNHVHITFTCPNTECNCEIEAYIEDSNFNHDVDRTEEGLGFTITDVLCRDCEHDYTVVLKAGPFAKEITLEEHPGTHVDFYDDTLDDRYEEFLKDYNPKDPFGVYQSTTSDISSLIQDSTIKEHTKGAFNRMLFLQHIIALEAYLSDRLIDIIMNDKEKLIAFVTSNTDFKAKKFTITDIIKDPDFLENDVKKYLLEYSFHKLAVVRDFYKSVLKVDIFSDDDHKKSCLKLIDTRHHLVHRNGRDKDKTPIVIELKDVIEADGLVWIIVDRIEEAHAEYIKDRAS